ncbi:FAD-dependent oxidoreductase [Pikeienuella piscinae]|uniref:FAD-dependent oxidoreductase n=1 Tax=Pikeienuella piscinae TaxID=2748098 RepID=A0A7L5C2E0_9RHOB|nr:FAD-dependent oxidoreductase [Pikeienuella piscinae]QIE56706.1 FAD-dependent oxidoreductase [Pikeienuella piscinae]
MSDPAETIHADVIVVGGGGSGLAAAVSAAEAGAGVTLIEKNDELGGSTRWSVGSITATCTAHQRAKGIEDDPDAHFEDLGKLAGPLANRDNLALRRILVDNVPETIRWLRAMGVEFCGPMEEPPHRKPRMHIVLPNSRAYIHRLAWRARRLDVDIRLGAQATRIVVEDGAATAVEADIGGRVIRFAARRGIVLAGGDYSGNAEMKGALVSPALAEVQAVNPTATGDCQRLVEAIGGEILNGDLALGPVLRFRRPKRRSLLHRIPPYPIVTRFMRWAMDWTPPALIRPFVMGFMTTVMGPEMSLFANGAVLVGADGAPLAREGKTLGEAVAATPGKSGWIVFDDALARRYRAWPHFVSTAPGVAYAYLPDYRRTRPDLVHTGPTPAALASRIGADPATLAAVLSGEPPFHALGPLDAYVVYTDGGVRVSDAHEVLRKDGAPISGLFAAGSTGQGGLLLEGHGHHLGWAFTSGRLAGGRAARFDRKD